MESLNHLKANYRSRYCYAKGQGQAIDIQKGENVLKYIQGRFENCARELTVCSPNESCCSSPHSVHTHVSANSKETSSDREKEKSSPDQFNCVKAIFDTLDTSSLSDVKDRSSDEDVRMSLGSPALLLEEEVKSSGDMQVINPDQNTIKPKKKTETSEFLTSTTRTSTKGCFGKLQLTYWKSPSPQLNNSNVELENECEFFIEESFGAPSASWLSVPQQNKQAEKKSLITVSSETKNTTELKSIKREDKRASNKRAGSQTRLKLDVSGRTCDELPDAARISERTSVLNNESQLVVHSIQQARKHTCSEDKQSVDLDNGDDQELTRENVHLEDQAALLEQHSFSAESRDPVLANQRSSFGKPVKQRYSRISLSKKLDVSGRTCDELPDVAKISGRTSVVNDQSQLVVHSIQQARKHTCSEDKQSVDLENEDDQELTRENVHSEDQAALLEQHSFSVESRDPVPANQQSSFGKPVKKQRYPRISLCKKLDVSGRTFAELPDVAKISGRTSVVNDPSQLVVHSIQQARKHTYSEDEQSVDQDNEDGQEPTRENVLSEDQASFLEQDHSFSVESRDTIHTYQQSSFSKSVKKQRYPRISESKKQSQIERRNVKRSVKTKGRKNRVSVSEESSESEHGEQQCDKQTKSPHGQRLNDLRKVPSVKHQKVTQTFLISSDDRDRSISHKQDSHEQYVAEKALIASMEQQNSATNSLQFSCATDASKNSGSGPVWDHKYKKTSKCENSSNVVDSVSDESVELEKNSEDFLPNSLKYKMVMPTNTPNVRRTKRIRLKPLEYWRGERVSYKTRPSGGFVVGGIISPEQKQLRKPNNKKRKSVMESENVQDDSMVSIKDPSQPAAVFDPVSKQEILLECVSSGSSHLLFVTNEALSIYKYFTTPSFSVGKIILKPLKEKGSQYSHSDTLVFHIIHGKLLLTLYDQCYSLAAGDYFYIPAGNIYNIRNLLNKECVIIFTQLKGNRLEEK